MDLRANGKTYSSVVFAGHASVQYQASNVGHCPPPPSDTSSRHRVPDANHPGTVLLLAAWVIWLCQGSASPDPHGRNNAIVRWVFHPLPRPVGFTLDLFYESGSRTPLKGCVVREAVHPCCSRPSPVRFTAPVRLLAAPPRGAGINGLGLMSGLVPNLQ